MLPIHQPADEEQANPPRNEQPEAEAADIGEASPETPENAVDYLEDSKLSVEMFKMRGSVYFTPITAADAGNKTPLIKEQGARTPTASPYMG